MLFFLGTQTFLGLRKSTKIQNEGVIKCFRWGKVKEAFLEKEKKSFKSLFRVTCSSWYIEIPSINFKAFKAKRLKNNNVIRAYFMFQMGSQLVSLAFVRFKW